MGQYLATANSILIDLIKSDHSTCNCTPSVSASDLNDINLFLSIVETSNVKSRWIKQVQKNLSILTNVSNLETINSQIDHLFMTNIFTSIYADYNRVLENIKEQFKTSSSLSHIVTSFKPTETNISTVQIQPVDRRLMSNIRSIEKQVENILTNFSSSKTVSLKNVLSLCNQLIFDTVNVYDVRNMFTEFNRTFTKKFQNISPNDLTYLTTIGIYPQRKIRLLQKNQFTGELISVFIFAHIDFYNKINADKQFLDTSISFEFHPHIFHQLFHIIEQLMMVKKEDFNLNRVYMLFFCLRLFTTHLKMLSSMSTNLYRDLLVTNENIRTTIEISSESTNLTGFISDDQLGIWFETLLILACQDQVKTEEEEEEDQVPICQQASKAIIYILNQKTSNFTEKLSLMFKYIAENKHTILIEQLLIELNTDISLLSWIEVLCDCDDHKPEKLLAFTILCSLVDIYVNSPSTNVRIEQIIKTLQHLLFIRLTLELESSSVSSFISKYFNHLWKYSNEKLALINDVLVGLCLMTTETEKKFNFRTIQPIFLTSLPLVAEFAVQNTTNQEIMYWLVGRTTRILLSGSPPDPLEMKHMEKLQSPLFAGGYKFRTAIEKNSADLSDLLISNIARYTQFTMIDHHRSSSSSDQDFLMSIYNNTDQGAKLLSKLKVHIRDKQRCLSQKSIEQQAHEACAALFAVYIKHYRRINLAIMELSRPADRKPHTKLLSLFEYANRIQTVFAVRKGQGDDCHDFYKQIKTKTHFLLFTIEESHLIPIFTNKMNEHIVQGNRKATFRLLRNVLQACIRLKKFAVTKTKPKNEDILHGAIDSFISENVTNDGSQLEVNELLHCLIRQFQRALTRLMTYRFAQTFTSKILSLDEKDRIVSFLSIYPLSWRNTNLQWSYLEHISASHIQLKEAIGHNYYSISQMILSYLLQSTFAEQAIFLRRAFHLLNLSYTSTDMNYLDKYEFLSLLFTPFVQSSDRTLPSVMKLIGWHWFRLYVLKLCENIHIKADLLFSKYIFNELTEEDSETPRQDDVLLLELDSNPYLLLLLHCVYSYEHIQLLCATHEYVEKLLKIYRTSHAPTTTILLALKILRRLIVYLPDHSNANSKLMIKTLLNDILLSEQTTSDIFTELIYIYRSIINTHKSPWQQLATQMLVNTIVMNMKSNQTGQVSVALCILGGYIHPFCLGSIVQVYVNNETSLAVITQIDNKVHDSNIIDARPYFVHYCESDQSEWVNADRLRIEIDVQLPNLLALPMTIEDIYSLFDAFIYFIQVETSLELKRRSMATLYRILNNKKILEIFLEKSYASIIVQLSTADLLSKNRQQPIDLRLWSKRHLEQYCLSLDRCQSLQQIVDETKDESSFVVWTDVPFESNRMTNISECYEWRSNGTKQEIQMFTQGRIGSEEIRLVSMHNQLAGQWLIEDCGIVHRFPGRICLINDTSETSIATFIVDNLQVNEGKWYFCVRLVEGLFIQIGWATTGFKPSQTIGIGNDQYSWSYDGCQGMLYNNESYSFLSEDIRWSTGDVCGCGIEIDGDQIRIHYWLNGHLLGTAFAHQCPIGSTATICDMLPNQCSSRTYFPGISLKVSDTVMLSSCEVIFSPEDMIECPLPKGYKALLMPTLINIDDLFVPYPYRAYLIGDQVQDYIYQPRNDSSSSFLRDFVNDHHLKTTMICNHHHQLILRENSDGLPLTIDHHGSLTLAFDFQLLTKLEQSHISLLTFDSPETFAIQIPFTKINGQTHIALVFQFNDRQTKIYINNECQTLNSPILSHCNIHLLPTIAAGIQNLAIWNYTLSEAHIHRLFTFGLSYVAMDYHRLNKYRKQTNTFTFVNQQKSFTNGLLVPFNGPFDENQWEEKKKHADEDESKYFKSIIGTNQSAVQLFGNQTYLVLEISPEPYSAYTLILDISISHLPKLNEQVTLVTLNEQSEIIITHNGQLYLSLIGNQTKIAGISQLKTNQFVRLCISVNDKSIEIYLNGLLQLHGNVDNDQLTIKDKRIDLFREHDLTKNTTDDDTLRIECQSITHLNRATNNITESLLTIPYDIVAPSLLRIGYDEARIKSAMIQKPTITNIQVLDTIIRENISWKFARAIDKEKLKDLVKISEFDTDEKIATLADIMLGHWNDIHRTPSPSPQGNPWFAQSVHHLEIDNNLLEWIRDKSSSTEEHIDLMYQLLDPNQLTHDTDDHHRTSSKSIQYSHQQITHEQYSHSRMTCEAGLISIYAHYTILNMLRVWSSDGSSLFPLEKFGDCTLIVTLIRLLDYHYTYTRLHTDENIDQMSLLVSGILKIEINELLQYQSITQEILLHKASILYRLQMNIIVQSIQLLSNPSLLSCDYSDQSMIKQANLNFILKIVHLFVQVIQQRHNDLLVPIIFPVPLINLLFDLFLLTPTHQSKTNILQLFSTLMQTSETFCLSTHIQHFLIRLFVELSSSSNPTLTNSSTTMKTFRSVLLDLVYLLYKKAQKNQTSQVFIGFDFPSSFHDLLMLIDVINALTDQTKQTPYPEAFLLQSTVLLGNDLRLSKDQIEQSHTYFDTIADLQLMTYMNNHPLMEFSVIELINRLLTESVLNPTCYKIYPSLWHIPATSIQTRAKIFYVFTTCLEKLLATIDFSLLPGRSLLIDKIRTAKGYMLLTTKFQLLNTTLEMTSLPSYDDGNIPSIDFDTVKASLNDDSDRSTMFHQAYEQLHENAHIIFRNSADQLWHAQYLNMHSTDQGGPYRDSISWICSDLNSTRLSLFILCPNGRTNSGWNRDRWIPNVYPLNQPISNQVKKQYRFVGQLLGMAIRKKHYLDLKFPTLLWKQLVRESVTIEDIEAIDVQSFSIIKQSVDIENIFLDDLRFEAMSSTGQTYELIPGGKDIPVTISNFKEYCTSYREYRLNEFNRQIECIRQGLYSVVPGYVLGLFTADELEEAVCGKGNIDVELLKRNTVYGDDYNEDSPSIQRFWIILQEMFTEEQKKLFLKFVWGRCTLPSCDDDFTSSFRINAYDEVDDSTDGTLPRSHTCSFALDLPEYSSIDIMYDRLNYAITYCSSIDGDGNMNEPLILTDQDFD